MSRLLFLDCRDSFSGIIADYFALLGQEVVWVDHEEQPEAYDSAKFSGMVLSPGPGRPEDSGNLMGFIDRFYDKLPILGICLGHQALAQYAGGRVGAAQEVVHGKVGTILFKEDTPMAAGLPRTLKVVRYHSLAVLDCGTDFEPTAFTETGQIMAMAHHSRPIWGYQWHPEALLSESGLRLLANWLTFAQIDCQTLALERHPEKPPMTPPMVVGPLLPI